MLQTADLNTQITERGQAAGGDTRLSTFFWHLANMIQLNVRVEQQPHIPETSQHPGSAQNAARAERRRTRNVLMMSVGSKHSWEQTAQACCQDEWELFLKIILLRHLWPERLHKEKREKIECFQSFHAADTQKVISQVILFCVLKNDSFHS